MKRILIACFAAFLLMSQCSFSADSVVDNKKSHTHHHRAHSSQAHSKSDSTQPVDINHADVTQLSTLKGIGMKKAQAIVAYRQAHGAFQSVNDLTKVKGVGLKMLVRLQKNNPGRITINMDKNIR